MLEARKIFGVCTDGHIIQSNVVNGRRFLNMCPQCGKAAIRECPSCGGNIPITNPLPRRCPFCGIFYPWSKAEIMREREMFDFDKVSIPDKIGDD